MRKSALMISAALVLPAIGTQARAAEQDKTETAAPGNRPSANDGREIRDIIVTAERRSEKLQKSSLAIQVLSSDDLQRTGITHGQDLGQAVPGLLVGQAGSSTQVFIRGVGDFSAAITSNPAVTFNVDGVVVARPSAMGMAFFDLDRIEVLKGPQGTLYGRNSTGGNINLITRKPEFDQVGGYLTLEGGNFGMLRGTGALNLPISDNLALRVAFDSVRRDGYLTDGTNDDRHNAIRLSVNWQPTEALSILTTADYARVTGVGAGAVPNPRPTGTSRYIGSGDPAAIAALMPLAGGFGAVIARAFDNFAPYDHNRMWSISNQIAYDLGNGVGVKLLTAYRRTHDDERNYPAFMNQQDYVARQFSSELQLSGNSDTLKWVAGLFYFNEQSPGTARIYQGPVADISASYPVNGTRSYAVFGQATYTVASGLRLIAGGRYTVDKRSVQGSQTTLQFGSPIYSTFGGNGTFKAFTWKAGAEYDLTPDNMAFISASTGFKAGGINFETGDNLFRPERLTAFEFGLRNRFLHNRLQLNLGAFYWRYKDHQEGIPTFDNTGAPNFLFVNSGKADLYGFNVDLVAKVTSQDTIKFFTEYNHSRYSSFSLDYASFAVVPGLSTGCPTTPKGPVTTVDCSGFPLARAPKWTGSASWNHRVDLGNGARIDVDGSLQFNSKRWLSDSFIPSTLAPAYVTENVDLSYTSAGGSWSITGYVHNLSNRFVPSGAQVSQFLAPLSYLTVGMPRTYGARVNVRF